MVTGAEQNERHGQQEGELAPGVAYHLKVSDTTNHNPIPPRIGPLPIRDESSTSLTDKKALCFGSKGLMFFKNRRYLLSHLQYYHRLEVLNFCVRDGNRCDHFDKVAGRSAANLFASPHLLAID